MLGLGAIGWFGYQYVGTGVVARQAYERTTGELERQWQAAADPTVAEPEEAAEGGKVTATAGAPEPVSGESLPDGTIQRIPGEASAIMRVPAWGEDWAVPILDGTDEDVLQRGLGWYENTVGPGQVGNFAVAGHVVTHGQPFRRLAELPVGSEVLVETREATYTYVVDSFAEVVDTETWVLDPVPGEPSAQPDEALITLTTCADVFRSPDRDIVFGHLVDVQAR